MDDTRALLRGDQADELGTDLPARSERPIVVIDTCVLLADPSALSAFPGTDIVLPLTVIEELDSQKSRGDEVGRAARIVLRRLEDLRMENGGQLRTATPLSDSSSLRIETNGLHLAALREASLDPTKADNRILAAALGLSQSSDRGVTVCSLDAALRIKAAQLGLRAETFAPSPPVRLEAIRTVEIDSPTMDALYSTHSVPAGDLAAVAAHNECLVLKSGTSSALSRRSGHSLRRLGSVDSVYGLAPRSAEQRCALELLADRSVPIVALTGHAGTGKSILALASALSQVFSDDHYYDRLMILRPMVSVGRQDMGFLPGDVADKLGPWFEAMIDTLVALKKNTTHRAARSMIDSWVESDRLSLAAPTFLRGRSLQSTFVITDEAQNLEPLVAKTILSRLGADSKTAFLGDISQIDSPWLSANQNALAALIEHCTSSSLFAHLHLVRGERSPAADLAASMP